jgi:hypothetical protein
MSPSSPNATSFLLRLRGGPPPPSAGGESKPAAPPSAPANVVDRLGKAMASKARLVHRPSGAVVLVRGGAPLVAIAAAALEKHLPNLPIVVAQVASILTEAGELEAPPAIGGLVFGGVRAEVLGALGWGELGEQVRGAPALVLAAEGAAAASTLGARGLGGGCFGGAALGESVQLLDRGGLRPVPLAALRFEGDAPRIESGSPIEPLSPPVSVTRAERDRLIEIDGRPALEFLGEHGATTGLVVVARGDGDDPHALELLTIRGVDPGAGAIVVSSHVAIGDTVRFARATSEATREALESLVARAQRRAHGAALRFAFYAGGVGAPRPAPGEPDPGARLLKRKLGATPFLGLRTETPWSFDERGAARTARLGHVFALFRAPS